MKNRFIFLLLLTLSVIAATLLITNNKYKAIKTMKKNHQTTELNKEQMPKEYLDNGIFKDYYKKAYNKLKKMSLEEKISQILLVRYPEENQKDIIKKYINWEDKFI